MKLEVNVDNREKRGKERWEAERTLGLEFQY